MVALLGLGKGYSGREEQRDWGVCGSPGESLLDTSEVWRCSAAGGRGHKPLAGARTVPHTGKAGVEKAGFRNS